MQSRRQILYIVSLHPSSTTRNFQVPSQPSSRELAVDSTPDGFKDDPMQPLNSNLYFAPDVTFSSWMTLTGCWDSRLSKQRECNSQQCRQLICQYFNVTCKCAKHLSYNQQYRTFIRNYRSRHRQSSLRAVVSNRSVFIPGQAW